MTSVLILSEIDSFKEMHFSIPDNRSFNSHGIFRHPFETHHMPRSRTHSPAVSTWFQCEGTENTLWSFIFQCDLSHFSMNILFNFSHPNKRLIFNYFLTITLSSLQGEHMYRKYHIMSSQNC